MNPVNARRARLSKKCIHSSSQGCHTATVTTGMGDRLRAGIPSRYLTSQLGQLSLASLRGRLIEYCSFGWGNGGNVSSAGWQVTLCDPMWHASFRSGVANLRTAVLLLLPCYFTRLPVRCVKLVRSVDVRPSYSASVFRRLLKTFLLRYDMRCYFNVRSKADISQLNLPHGTDN